MRREMRRETKREMGKRKYVETWRRQKTEAIESEN
jgi:hypothetical protein